MKQTLLILCFLCLTTFGNSQDFVKNEVIVMLQPNANWKIFEQEIQTESFFYQFQNTKKTVELIDDLPVKIEKILSESMKIGLLKLSSTVDELEVLTHLNNLNSVRTVQLNYIGEYRNEPNDENYEKQWYLHKIAASDAWNYTTGGISPNGDTIVVFIIDNGFNVSHEDLNDNIWTNYAEIPNNGIDDDMNGYVDDFQGWNLSENSGEHFPSIHGTRVTGIIGGKGNNKTGISGINWNIKILPFGIQRTDLTPSNVIEAYDYALEMRKRYDNSNGTDGAYICVTNLSAGFNGFFPDDLPIICEMYDLLGEAGIMNVSSAPNTKSDVSIQGDVPTLCTSPYIIPVTATDSSDLLIYSYNANAVDLAAPGKSIFSTQPVDNYGNDSGTSFAAPQVTGTLALMYSYDNEDFAERLRHEPAETGLWLKDMMLQSTDKLNALSEKTVSGGRLNIGRSLNLLNQYYQGWSESLGFVNLYPNPVEDLLNIVYQTPDTGSFDILLFNNMGQLLLNQQVTANEIGFKTIQLEMSNYQKGVYYVMLKNSTQTEIKKIIVY